MASAAVRVYGVREVNRAFRQIDRQLASDFRKELQTAAEPVVAAAKGKIARYQGASLGTIVARRSGPRVFVVQNARKVTGKRGDYGSLQMKKGLLPALYENRDRVLASVELVLDKYGKEAGF